ncbi:hypothetical protein D915_005010 [Fasciola hepatica]|uniref:Uncharacterized protein n=1 Tax=Fasciola hepatica TaxID=6192 RepID=A0A4E0RTQ5_FASHE|nr:hypothetical protein D915_005010 [Fasciola hepatica]
MDSTNDNIELSTNRVIDFSQVQHKMQVAIFDQGTFTPNYLFTTNPIGYDPETDPLPSFKADQLERLNPRVQREIEQLHAISLCDQSNIHPPSTDGMETYMTCLDVGEWNAGCHLKDKVIIQLPCVLPNVMVRLTPNYLETGLINW